MTETEALAQIAALCDEAEASSGNYASTLFGLTDAVRAVLADVEAAR